MTAPLPFTAAGLRAGARHGLPLAAADPAYGLIFGALARQAGLSLPETVLMSATVNAGAAQLATIELWRSPLPLLAIVATTLAINARHLFLGATLAPLLNKLSPRRRFVTAFFLSDESWVLTQRHLATAAPDGAFMLGVGLVLFVGWVGTSAAGFALGAALPNPGRWGLDFAFPALFAALLATTWDGPRRLAPWLVAAAVSIVATRWLPPGWPIPLAALAGAVTGAIADED